MLFKKKVIAGLIAVTMGVLVGCSSADSSGKIELRYAIWDQTHKDAVETLISEYEGENPDVDIKLEQYSFADYWTKMETAATGGSAPDIYWMNAVNLSLYADSGVIVNMDDYIKENKIDMSQYLDNITSIYNYEGSQYAMPSFWDANILMVNKEMLKEYNIPEPTPNWNWDEMMAWLKDAKTKLPDDVYPITSYGTESTQLGVFNEVAGAGGSIISEDKTKSMINTPETTNGFKKYFDLLQSDVHSPADITTEIGAGTLFKSNKALAIQAGTYHLFAYSDAEQSQVAGKFGIYEIPTIKEGVESNSVIHGLGNVISSNCKNPDEAFDFINYMSSEESMKKYTELAVVPQAHKNVQQLYVDILKDKLGIDASILDEVSKNAMPLPNTFETAKWGQVITDNTNALMQGKISFDEAIKACQDGVQEILDSENK